MSYESEQLRDWYILFHYGTGEEILDGTAFSIDQLPSGCLDFPTATVGAFGEVGMVERALDLGCAVGRSSYELSKIAGEVTGIDYSQAFVDAAAAIGTGEPLPYHIYYEGHLRAEAAAELPAGVSPERVSFERGDAMNLRDDLGSFDLVHAANLLCRLTEPKKFLDRLPDLVRPGGHLVMATPATWMTEYTPQENQPSGLTLDYLDEHLGQTFERQSVQEIPFFIREHQRKCQLSTSQTSLWRRKG